MIVDSGTTLIYLPNSVAVIVNSLFDPLATFDTGSGQYVANCSVVAPKFGVYIGGQLFYVNTLDDAENRAGWYLLECRAEGRWRAGGVGGGVFEECTRCVRCWGW